MEKLIITGSAEQTIALGRKIGTRLRGGEVIELISDLGGGKTTFTTGLAQGFGSHDQVASPSFTISREYISGDKIMHHYDFYRLNEPGIMADELAENMNQPDLVVVIEWPEIVEANLPAKRLSIMIKTIDNTKRQFLFKCGKGLEYLLEDN